MFQSIVQQVVVVVVVVVAAGAAAAAAATARLGSANNTYLDLDSSGYHKNLIQ